MNILNLLRSRDERSYQAWLPTKSGKLIMSVVCGQGLYSSPREKVKPNEYTSVEVAFFNAETLKWASYNEVKEAFPIIGEGEYAYAEEYNQPISGVFGYVEVEKVNQVWEIM